MVLGLKPMGKLTTLRKNLSFGQNQDLACMVLELKPMGKPTTLRKNLSFGQNQGLAWFSDSNLWFSDSGI